MTLLVMIMMTIIIFAGYSQFNSDWYNISTGVDSFTGTSDTVDVWVLPSAWQGVLGYDNIAIGASYLITAGDTGQITVSAIPYINGNITNINGRVLLINGATSDTILNWSDCPDTLAWAIDFCDSLLLRSICVSAAADTFLYELYLGYSTHDHEMR